MRTDRGQLTVKTNVKDNIDLNVGTKFYDALDEKVAELLAEAEDRATANGRKTVLPQDI